MDLTNTKTSDKIKVEGKYSCYKCNSAVVSEEFQRCPACESAHKELCAKLDSRPINKIKKPKEELFAIKSMRRGVEFTDLVTRQDALVLGIKLPE